MRQLPHQTEPSVWCAARNQSCSSTQTAVWSEGFSSPRREGMHAAGDPYLRRFVDPERNLAIEIDGRIGDPMPMGQRIDRVIMRIQQPDDTLLVMPLIGHYACR